MSFPRYEKYKDSGVEWLGEVPEHWKVKRVRHLLRQSYDGLKIGPFGSQLTSQMLVPSGYKVFGQENVIANDFTLGERFITEEKLNELAVYEIKSGDILITMMGTSGRCAIVPDNLEIGIMDSHLLRMRVVDEIRHRFIQLLIDESVYIAHQIRTLGKGSIMHGLNSSIIKELILTVPSVVEQDSILSFLNRETTKIDELIAEQQRLIELLKEKRQAVISHAVTKGLNPDAPMKDSGVEWLGEVPEHWEVKRLRFVALLNPSKSEATKLDRETEVSFLPMEAIGDDGTLSLERTRSIGEVEMGYTYFQEGDVTIAKITPCFENGKGAVMRGLFGGIGFGTTELIVARPILSHTISDYLHWIFISTPFRKLGQASMYGAGGQKRVPDDFVRNFAIAFPNAAEQKQITIFLDYEIAKIDTLTTEAQTAITLLQERRIALISSAVSGKIDVSKFV
jgi:type I restriction enzyme S subunit